MRIVVGHHLWSRAGGGEIFNAYIVKTLLEIGHKVSVATTFGFDWSRYREWFGINVDSVKIYRLFPRTIPLFGLYLRLGFWIPLMEAIKREKPDIVFVDSEIYKPILKLKSQERFKLVEYIHFPFHALLLESNNLPPEYRETSKRYFEDVKMYHGRYEKGLLKLYFKLWLKLYGRFARDNPFECADLVMANSKYIARLIKLIWHGNATVLYPPVRVRDFDFYNAKGFDERDNAVIMIGRISSEKRIENAIEALALTETKPILRIVGGLIHTRISYMNWLKHLARKKNVKIEFYPNAPRDILIKLATSSKVFVHTTIGEHFGVAVVEGMAAGCSVIVHRSGGPFEDIIDQGRYGLYYRSVEELAKNIDRILTDEKLWRHYHELSLLRARDFDDKKFIERFANILEKLQ